MPLNYTICLTAYEIYQSIWYNLVLSLVVLLNISGFCLLAKTFKLLLKSQKFHLNLRILLLNVTLGIFLRSLATTIRALHRIFRAIFVSEPCNFVTTLLYCVYESGIQSIPLATVNNTLPIICLERFIATVLSKKYESKKFVFFYSGLSVLTWIYAGYSHLSGPFSMPISMASDEVAYCSSVAGLGKPDFYYVLLSHNFLFPFCSGIFFMVLWYFCKWRKTEFIREKFPSHSLSQRYQLTELMKTTQVICCLSILFSCLFNGQAFFITCLTKFEIITTEKVYSVVKEAGSLSVVPIFINVFGATFYSFLSPRNKSTYHISKVLKKSKRTVAPKLDEGDAYFHGYANAWK